MTTADERLARLEEQVKGLREDAREVQRELGRTRTRLHNLEGVAGAFVETQRENRRLEQEQYRRLGLRIQVLTLVVGFAAVLAPIVTVILSGK